MFQGAYVILDGAPHRNTRDVCVCERDAIKKIDRKRKRKWDRTKPTIKKLKSDFFRRKEEI